MKTLHLRNLLLVIILLSSSSFIRVGQGATIPSGATLVVRMDHGISSDDRIGTTFSATLDQNVMLNGRAMLRAGTRASGTVTASRQNRQRSGPLTVTLATLSQNGRTLPIRTDAVQPRGRTARELRNGTPVGRTIVAVGTRVTFRLAQPLHL